MTPAVAERLLELCDDSKPFLEDGTLNEEAAGDDQYCRWAVMAFPNGEWAKFKSFLVEYEATSKEMQNQLRYYSRIIDSRNNEAIKN